MWLVLAFLSATLLGFYDSFKKKALQDSDVFTVLFLNTLFCTLIFIPFILLSYFTHTLDGSIFHVAMGGWHEHRYIILKAIIVLSSWIFGYFGMKHVPLTIYGPINATRPVLVLLGAILVFGERLNGWQWAGVLLALASFLMLSRSSKKEGINFKHDKWIWMIALSAILGAVSGLYDKYLMAGAENGGVGIDKMMVQSWYNFYQMLMMGLAIYVIRRFQTPGHVTATKPGRSALLPIFLVSLFLSMADFAYFYALSLDGALISIVSMVRRGSVVVSFLCGAVFFHEKNLKSKALDLALVLLGMICLWIGSL